MGDYLGGYFFIYIFVAFKFLKMIIAHKHNSKIAFGNKYKNGSFSIRIRVTYAGERIDLYTNLSATEKQWDAKKNRYKQGVIVGGVPFNILNNTIDEYIRYIDEYFNRSSLREEKPMLKDLKKQFKYTFKQSNKVESAEFFYQLDSYIQSRNETRRWSKSYKDMFVRLGSYLQLFNSDLRFCDFNTDTMNKFLTFLSQKMRNDKIVKMLRMLTEFLNYAKKKKYPVNEEFFEFDPMLKQSKTDVRYLTIEELKAIINLDLEEGTSLSMSRDFFVFQCHTAFRYSDLKSLKRDNIRLNSDGRYEIDKLTQKDKDRVSFPLSAEATRIYQKYKDNIYDNNVVFPLISNQKYNEYLHTLGQMAGIEGEWVDYQYCLGEVEVKKTPRSNITSHTARRTFVVTALNEGVSLDLIAQITSHADIDVMKPYIASTLKGKQDVINAIDNAMQ